MKNWSEINNEELIIDMINGKILHGFYFNIGRMEFFVSTTYKNKTENLARKILRMMNLEESMPFIQELMYKMEKANCEIKFCKGNHDGILDFDSHYYFNIFGNYFGGFGSEDITDGRTIVFTI